jgi:hypothetical protein
LKNVGNKELLTPGLAHVTESHFLHLYENEILDSFIYSVGARVLFAKNWNLPMK